MADLFNLVQWAGICPVLQQFNLLSAYWHNTLLYMGWIERRDLTQTKEFTAVITSKSFIKAWFNGDNIKSNTVLNSFVVSQCQVS